MVGVPLGQGAEHLPRPAAVNGEVVVDQEDVAEAMRVQRGQFGQDLVEPLVALLAALVLDDVAEFAIERAAARGLERSRHGAAGRVQVPARHRGETDVARPRRSGRPRPGRKVGEQRRRERLGQLAGDQHVRVRAHVVGTERGERAADQHRASSRRNSDASSMMRRRCDTLPVSATKSACASRSTGARSSSVSRTAHPAGTRAATVASRGPRPGSSRRPRRRTPRPCDTRARRRRDL